MTDADRAFCSLFEGPRLTAFANRGEVAEETKQLAVKDATERWRVVLHSCTQGLKGGEGESVIDMDLLQVEPHGAGIVSKVNRAERDSMHCWR